MRDKKQTNKCVYEKNKRMKILVNVKIIRRHARQKKNAER